MFKTFRKSQAAMEFLMTYGWAILVVLVAIGALAYFGVLSPDRFLPAKCQLPAGIACTDFMIDDATDTVSVVLRNGLGFTINPIEVRIAGTGGVCGAAPGTLASGGSGVNDDCAAATCVVGTDDCTLDNGDLCTYAADCSTSGAIGSGKFSGTITVTYTNQDSGLQHDVEGTITGRAE